MSQWKLVPVEPTDEMIEASGVECLPNKCAHQVGVELWNHMLAAAPQPAGEPVAYVGEISEGVELYLSRNDFVGRSIPLFTYPPDAQARIAELEKQLAEKDKEIARRVTVDEMNAEIDSSAKAVADHYERKLSAAQSKIDSLMLEYCPEEMTPEQVDEWGKHQVPVNTGGI